MIIRPDNQHKPSPLRLVRGTKLSDIPNEAPPKLSEIESAFHIAEYLALLVRHDPHDIRTLVAIPEGMERKKKGNHASHTSDDGRNMWVYEHLRRLPVDLTVLVTSLLGTCTAETCPKMKAEEWQYLCTAHGNEGAEECSAIDYILHTLDSTTALLTFHEIFPSRITILDGSVAHFPSLFRRLSRIFSHAYYSHRELFQLAEVETSLYARFVALCEKYDLVGSNLLVIPRRVVADTIDGKLDHEDDDSEEDELDDEDLDIEEEEERGSRRREKDEEGGRRPHSLDRHARPHKLDDLRQKVDNGAGAAGAGTVKGKPDDPNPTSEPEQGPEPVVDTPSTSTMAQSPMNPDPISLSTTKTYSLKPRSKSDKDKINNSSTTGTLGRSTLGKKSRGTMLWSSDTPSSASPSSITPTTHEQGASTPIAEIGQPLERTESTETAIHTLSEEDLEGEGPVDPSQVDLVHETETESETEKADEQKEKDGVEEVEAEKVPKDEIELLEEEGVLDSAKEDTVSPLPVPSIETTDSTTGASTSGSADLTNPQSESENKDEGGVESTEAESKVDDQTKPEPTDVTGPEVEVVPTKEESFTTEPTSTPSSASGAATDKDTSISSNTPETTAPSTATSDLAGKEKKDKPKVKGKKDSK